MREGEGGGELGRGQVTEGFKELGFNSKCDKAPLHGCSWENIGSGVL